MKFVTIIRSKSGKEYFHIGYADSINELDYMINFADSLHYKISPFLKVISESEDCYLLSIDSIEGFYSYIAEEPKIDIIEEVLQ